MQLLPEEDYLVRSNDDTVVLTTHRIKVRNKDWGMSYQNVIFLEDISSIEIRYSSWFIVLVLGFVLIGTGLFIAGQNNGDLFNIATGGGALLILLYFLSRKHVVTITPDGGKGMDIQIKNMQDMQVEDFIEKVQIAKMARRKNG